MITVEVWGPAACQAPISGVAGPYRFGGGGAECPSTAGVRLEVVERELRAPFVARGPRDAVVTTHLADEIALYAGITRSRYLQGMALCAVVQARALALNALLRPEDLRHAHPACCLLSERWILEDYFQLVESPQICRGCRLFLRDLCPAEEVAALEAHVAALTSHARAAGLFAKPV